MKDENVRPVAGELLEIWQADSDGFYPPHSDANFTGWGRSTCDQSTGAFRFETIKPGPIRDTNGAIHASHITVWIVARSMNISLHNRAYFANEVQANRFDPILSAITYKSRINTLMAQNHGTGAYHFGIYIQGATETVFFDI